MNERERRKKIYLSLCECALEGRETGKEGRKSRQRLQPLDEEAGKSGRRKEHETRLLSEETTKKSE